VRNLLLPVNIRIKSLNIIARNVTDKVIRKAVCASPKQSEKEEKNIAEHVKMQSLTLS